MGRAAAFCRSLRTWLAEAFEFSTPHRVIFKDWRLTALEISFTWCIVVYVTVKSLLLWSVIEYEDIAAGFNSWCFTSWTPTLGSPHCGGNPDFDLAPVNVLDFGGLAAYNHTCPMKTGAQVMRQVGGEAQVTVWQQLQRGGECQGKNIHNSTDANGRPCVESYFMDGVEDLPLFLIHTVSASSIGVKKSNLPCRIMRSGSEEVLGQLDTPNNNGWPFTLRELLQYAGNVTLDDFNEGNVVPVREGTLLRLRHTGFILTLRFRYWSFKAWPERYWDFRSFPWDWRPSEPQCALEVELQPQAWGFVGADSHPEGSVLSSVARIQFIGMGQFGRLSWLLVVSSLVEAFVLMGIASQVTLYFARFLYGAAFRSHTETTFEKRQEDAGTGIFGRATFHVSSKSGLSVSPAAPSPSLVTDAGESRSLPLQVEGSDELLRYLERRLLGLSDQEARRDLPREKLRAAAEGLELSLEVLSELRASWRAEDEQTLDDEVVKNVQL